MAGSRNLQTGSTDSDSGRAKRRGVAYTLVSDYPSGMRLDGIAKFTGNEVKKAHLDAEGKLDED